LKRAAFALSLTIALARTARADEPAPAAPPPPPASAPGDPVVVWPTLTPAGDEAARTPVHRPLQSETTFAHAQELDATLRDAVQDLGYVLDVADPGPLPSHMRDLDLMERAAHSGHRSSPLAPDKGTWVVSARIEELGRDDYLVRIVAVPPLGRELKVRVAEVKGDDVSVRGLVLVRDLLSPADAERAAEAERARTEIDRTAGLGIMGSHRSPGRAVLAVNAGLFGAFAAYSVQRTSGSTDPRLLYPLLALGTGIGVGSSLLVSEEWDISTGDAFVLAAGAWTGAASGILIANGRHVEPLTDRYAWGIGGGVLGLALSTAALTRSTMDEGDAVLTVSGAGIGAGLGALSELFYRGSTTTGTPYTGTGYGAAIGLVLSEALATQLTVSPNRALLIDLGAALGAASGAAVASPLVFGDLTPGRARGFVATTAAGTLAGGGLTYWLTRHDGKKPPAEPTRDPAKTTAWSFGQPLIGPLGQSLTRTGTTPIYGLGWEGDF
jgi:hypothetical protein